MLLATVPTGVTERKPSVLVKGMGVDKATAIIAALVGGMMLAGVRSGVISRAESTSVQATSQAVKRLNETGQSGSIDGFQSAEDFAAAVHASRNVRVPFTDLKHQIVDEGNSLPAAIHAVKPTANASLEADLARSEARADLAAIK